MGGRDGWHTLHQVGGQATEGEGEAADVKQRQVAFSAFDTAYVSAMEPGGLGESFLRKALRQAAPLHLLAEHSAGVHGGETRPLMTLVLQPISSAVDGTCRPLRKGTGINS